MRPCRHCPGSRAVGHRGGHPTGAGGSVHTLTGLASACQLREDRVMGAARRSVAVLATAIVAALGIAALVHAQRHPDQALGGAGAGAWALQFAAGVGAWMAGVHLALRRSLR